MQDFGPATQVLLRKGDVVLAHQKLAHFGGANCSPDIRYQVYFRVGHLGRRASGAPEQDVDALLDPLRYFPGVSTAVAAASGSRN